MAFQIPHIYNKENRRRLFILSAIVAVAVMFSSYAWADPRKENKTAYKTKDSFTLVIDAGHGGHDHGAIDNGAREKDINLGVAKKLEALVKKKLKNVKVVMTRDDDTFISLQERADIANRNRGNLFVSIHTNSVDKSNPNRKSVSGASVYALGPQKDANNLKVAQRENSVIELEDNYHQKYSGFDPSKDESYIIFEMAQKKNLGQSLRFADKAQKELVKTASRKDRGVKQAGFWVLWATSMPAVLVELDFICNPTQAAYMKSDAGQEKLAEALLNALKNYIETYHNTADVHSNVPANMDIAEQTEPKEEEIQTDTGVSTLIASSKPEKVTRSHRAASNSTRDQSGSRKRRSESAKRLSDNRNYETESITLKSETDFLAIREKKVEKAEEPEVTDKPETPTSKKDKKSKSKSKAKDKEKKNTNQKKSKGGTKTYVVKSSNPPVKSDKPSSKKTTKQSVGNTAETNTIEKTGIEHASRPVPSNRGKTSRMLYTILLHTSDREISDDDPVFCGITPTGKFIENGRYKYTYNQSENRREIEQKLLEVKTLIPGASIMVRNE